MKQNFKIFLIALLIGAISSYFFAYKFDNTITALAKNSYVTYFYIGTYNTLESARNKQTNYPDSLILNDNGIYKVVIGIYSNNDTIALMSSFFKDQGLTFETSTLKVPNNYLKTTTSYENLIKTSDTSLYPSINKSILNVFSTYIT